MKRILVSALLLALLSSAPIAQAEPVQEFNVQLKDVKPDGRYTIVFTANSFDTSGEPPPLLTSNTVRFAAGREHPQGVHDEHVQVRRRPAARRAARRRRRAATSSSAWTTSPRPTSASRAQMTPESRKVVETCIRSQIGAGTVVVDARTVGLPDPLPAKLYLFLSKPQAKGAFASFGIFAVLDEAKPAIQALGSLSTLKLVFATDLYNEPSADGLYGVKMVLPTGSGLRISVAELKVTTPGHHEDDGQEDVREEARPQVREVHVEGQPARSGSRSRPARPAGRSRSARTTATRRDWPPSGRSRCPARASSSSAAPDRGVHGPSSAPGRPSSDGAGRTTTPQWTRTAHGSVLSRWTAPASWTWSGGCAACATSSSARWAPASPCWRPPGAGRSSPCSAPSPSSSRSWTGASPRAARPSTGSWSSRSAASSPSAGRSS